MGEVRLHPGEVFSVSAITIFYKKLETREMEMMLRASKNIARLMARYSGERVRGNVTLQRRKLER